MPSVRLGSSPCTVPWVDEYDPEDPFVSRQADDSIEATSPDGARGCAFSPDSFSRSLVVNAGSKHACDLGSCTAFCLLRTFARMSEEYSWWMNNDGAILSNLFSISSIGEMMHPMGMSRWWYNRCRGCTSRPGTSQPCTVGSWLRTTASGHCT